MCYSTPRKIRTKNSLWIEVPTDRINDRAEINIGMATFTSQAILLRRNTDHIEKEKNNLNADAK